MKFAKPYNDLREFITALDEAGKLYRIHREINKDTELQPLVRWQFRGLTGRGPQGILFDNVTDPRNEDIIARCSSAGWPAQKRSTA